MITVTKRFHWEAAHSLPNHPGKCQKLHGHSYIIEVTVGGEVVTGPSNDPGLGMVLDFDTLSSIVNSCSFDHTYLNDIISNPTAENIVQWLANEIEDTLTNTAELVRVRLYETEGSYAEWTP